MGQVLVAYADADAEIGARVAAALANSGLAVASRAGARRLKTDKERFDQAAALVLVWSRHTAPEAGLRRQAVAAAAIGALTVARVDGAGLPPSLRTSRTFTIARANAIPGVRALAKCLAAAPAGGSNTSERTRRMNATMNEDTRNYGSTWKGTILLALLLGGVAYGTLYCVLGGPPAPFIMGLFK